MLTWLGPLIPCTAYNETESSEQNKGWEIVQVVQEQMMISSRQTDKVKIFDASFKKKQELKRVSPVIANINTSFYQHMIDRLTYV